VSSEHLLPAELRALFADSADGRRLSVPLPPGRLVFPQDDGDRPAFWLSDGPAPVGAWARLRAEHQQSGLWPLLLDALDDEEEAYRPWGNGEVCPSAMSHPADHEPAALLAGWWRDNTEESDDDELTPEERRAVTAPYGDGWPGKAPVPPTRIDADHAADGLAERVFAGHSTLRLGLVAAKRGADAVTVAGWEGAVNYVGDTAEISSVLRDWEDRFGARVVGVGFSTLLLSVAAPPTTKEEALAVAAEHFAFCPDNVWQGHDPQTLTGYAKRIVKDHSWAFWWD
jgi:hypothetical protein